MFDDYICAFKQSTFIDNTCKVVHLIMVLIGMNYCLGRLSNDLVRFATVVANYTSRSSFINCLSHLKGEEVFGSSKWPNDYPPNVDDDSNRPNHVNFFHPWITIPLVEPNIMDNVHMQQPPSSSSKLLPLVFQGGLELKESICVDIAHPILQFNVLHWKKPQRSNAK